MNRFRLRFSLLNLLMVTAIVCLSIALWRTNAKLTAITNEVMALRAEMGHVFITDPTKVHAIQVARTDDGSSRWRIYLPPGRKFSIHCYCGQYTGLNDLPVDQWLKNVTTKYTTAGTMSGANMDGEFTLDAKLVKKNGQWILQFPPLGEDTAYTSDDWIADPRARYTWGKVPAEHQAVFEPGEPILLQCIQKGVLTTTGSGFSIAPPTGPVDSIVLWIDEKP